MGFVRKFIAAAALTTFLAGCGASEEDYLEEYEEALNEFGECLYDTYDNADEPWEYSKEESVYFGMDLSSCLSTQKKQLEAINTEYDHLGGPEKAAIAMAIPKIMKDFETNWTVKTKELISDIQQDCFDELGENDMKCRKID